MAVELFANLPSTTVSSGGTTAPAPGTSETWTVASSSSFPAASTGVSGFHIADIAANSEIIAVTNVSGTTWTVTRGAESTTPVAHTAGFTIYQVVTAGALNQIRAVDWINVVTVFGADSSGSTDCTTALQAAIAALPGGAGRIYFPAGSYKFSGTLSFIQGQGIIGDGSDCVFLHYTGSGTAISVALSGSFTGGAYGGVFEGFYVDGYSAGSSAVGFQHGDLQGTTVSDVAVYGFAGKGAYFANTAGRWSEQMNIRMRLVQCGAYGTNSSGSVVFDTSSFDYSNFDFLFGNTSPPAHGLVMQGGAQLQGCHLRMRGNFYGRASANASAVIAIDPGNTSGTSYIANTAFDVALEGDGSGVGPWLVLMGSSNSTSQFYGSGVLSFANAGVSTQGISNANFLPFGFSGIIGNQQLGSILSFGQDYLFSTDGTDTSNGAVTVSPYQRTVTIRSPGVTSYATTGLVVSSDSTATSGGAIVLNPNSDHFGFISIYSSTFGGPSYFVPDIIASHWAPCFGAVSAQGFGVAGSTHNAGDVCFAVLNFSQTATGLGSATLTCLDNNTVVTFSNTLDNGSGAASFAGVVAQTAGTDTSGTATASSPSFVSGTAQQLSTTQDVILYIAIQTAAALAVAIGPTSNPANTIMPSQSYALGLQTIRVPKSWYVKITGTIADLTITQVTC